VHRLDHWQAQHALLVDTHFHVEVTAVFDVEAVDHDAHQIARRDLVVRLAVAVLPRRPQRFQSLLIVPRQCLIQRTGVRCRRSALPCGAGGQQ
jgi:hypothetical protein